MAKKKSKARARMGKKINRNWAIWEIRDLKRKYKKQTAREIAEDMDRTLASVQGKIQALGLKK